MLHRIRPFLDFEELKEVITSEEYLDSTNIREFEKNFKYFVGSSNAFSVDQGRLALFLGLKSLGLRRGDEVIVQSFICNVVVDAILASGATPVLVDNSLDDYGILPTEVEKKITPKTKAIIAAHIYGIPCEIHRLREISDRNGCFLFEDCAQALDSTYRHRKVGNFGDVSFFSFGFDKPLTVGKGGMLVVNNKELNAEVEKSIGKYACMSIEKERLLLLGLLIEFLMTAEGTYSKTLSIGFGEKILSENRSLCSKLDRLLRKESSEQEFRSLLLKQRLYRRQSFFSRLLSAFSSRYGSFSTKRYSESSNFLMNSMRSFLGNKNLRHHDSVKKVRNRNAAYFSDSFRDNEAYRLPVVCEGKAAAFLRYTMLNKTEHPTEEISAAAYRRGFEIGNYNWNKPVHLMRPYSSVLKYDRKELQNSEHLAENVINLPIHHYVSNEDREEIVRILDSFTRR